MLVAVAGLGLIGGSVLYALRDAGHEVIGYDADADTRALAAEAGFTVADRADALTEAPVCVLAVPLPAVAELLPGFVDYRGLLTDVTSVKAPVVELAAKLCPGARFVAGHPMAGKEISGFVAAEAALFRHRVWALCLESGTDLGDWLRMAELVTGLGAEAVPVTAAEHDAAVARISHLPHLVAAALTQVADEPLARALAAGSFADATRVAASSPDLVGAMCGGNADQVREALGELLLALAKSRTPLSAADPVTAVRDWFASASESRLAWPPVLGDPEPVPVSRDGLLDFGRSGGRIQSVRGDPAAVVGRRPAG